MLEAIFSSIGSSVTGIFTAIGNSINGATSLFYANDALTTFGTLSLAGLGVGIGYMGFRWIRNLVKLRG